MVYLFLLSFSIIACMFSIMTWTFSNASCFRRSSRESTVSISTRSPESSMTEAGVGGMSEPPSFKLFTAEQNSPKGEPLAETISSPSRGGRGGIFLTVLGVWSPRTVATFAGDDYCDVLITKASTKENCFHSDIFYSEKDIISYIISRSSSPHEVDRK